MTTVPPDKAALSTYREFWRVTDAARAAPSAQDWKPKIEALATGQALKTALTDVENYRSLPAHVEGTITRDPQAVTVQSSRVSILDCVDLGAVRLVSDATGKRLDDVKNRVQRYRLTADVVVGADGRWLVDTTKPELDQKC